MRWASGILLAASLCGGVFAQTVRSFGSVVFPGGTSAINPGITRNFGSVVFPGGSPSTPPVRSGTSTIVPPIMTSRPSTIVPAGGNSFHRGNSGNSFNRPGPPNRGNGRTTPVYAYPVFVPGYFDYTSGGGDQYVPTSQPPVEQPNVTVVYPQQQEVRPMIMQMPPDRQPASAAPAPAAAPEPEPETTQFLIAFKDHTIYTVVAYWFDGDTLHYFTKGDKHNQAPVALLDRDLTDRLNREMGIDFKLPPVK